MKVTKNAEHNSIELDFEGAKPSDELRKTMKAYGFWWFREEKKWIHTLEVDGEFFEKFVEERVKPLAAAPAIDINAAVASMSEADKQELLAKLMGM